LGAEHAVEDGTGRTAGTEPRQPRPRAELAERAIRLGPHLAGRDLGVEPASNRRQLGDRNARVVRVLRLLVIMLMVVVMHEGSPPSARGGSRTPTVAREVTSLSALSV